MSQQTPDQDAPDGDDLTSEEYGSLTIEDEPGTVNPADLAGTATPSDDEVGYEPEFSEADEPGDDSE